jgi:hypothetical protein
LLPDSRLELLGGRGERLGVVMIGHWTTKRHRSMGAVAGWRLGIAALFSTQRLPSYTRCQCTIPDIYVPGCGEDWWVKVLTANCYPRDDVLWNDRQRKHGRRKIGTHLSTNDERIQINVDGRDSCYEYFISMPSKIVNEINPIYPLKGNVQRVLRGV